MEKLKDLSYPKQFILKENKNKRIYNTLNNFNDYKTIDEYLYEVVTVIQEKKINDSTYSEIQHEDKKLGWIEIQESIQIFRFSKEVFRFIEDDFKVTSINEKMKLDKDFKSHLANKLVNVKSEIKYNGEWLYGVFIKDKFFGFHQKHNFERIIHCDVFLSEEEVENITFFKNSDMKTPLLNEINFENPKILLFFKYNKIARVKVNQKEYYWMSLKGFEDKIKNYEEPPLERTIEQKYLDDIFYSIDIERQKSKEIVKTVFEAKSYIKAKKSSDLKLDKDESKIDIQELNKEILDQKKQIFKLTKELNLSNKRLDQKIDYSNRLEQQRDRYKARMKQLEEKLEALRQKSKEN